MPYRGEAFVMDLNMGGFNYDKNTDRVPAVDMVGDSENIDLHEGGRSKRGGTAHVNETAIGGTPRIWGIYEYRREDGTSEVLTADANGEILSDYDDASPVMATGTLTINRPVHFETFNNICYICTGNNIPYTYDGTTIAVMANPATEWDGTGSNLNYPRKMITHGRGASERLWAIYGATDPYTVFYSNLSQGDNSTKADFTTGNGTLYIDTKGGFGGINAGKFGDRLICAGKNRTYIIDDEDATASNWGYEQSQWTGGTANDRTFIVVANDIVSLTEDLVVYSVVAKETYGDYEKVALSRTQDGSPFMDEYMKHNLKVSAIADWHMVYDPVLRRIHIFAVRSGETNVDIALTYYIDKGPRNGWTILGNRDAASGYRASCSAVVRKAVGDNKVYTGGMADGFVWELATTAANDEDAAYAASFETPHTHFGDPMLKKRFDTVHLVVETSGSYNLTVDIWIDGSYRTSGTVDLSGVGGTYGTTKWGPGVGEGVYGNTELIEAIIPIGIVGKRIKYFISNDNADETFYVSHIYTDFKPLGRVAY